MFAHVDSGWGREEQAGDTETGLQGSVGGKMGREWVVWKGPRGAECSFPGRKKARQGADGDEPEVGGWRRPPKVATEGHRLCVK